MNIDISTDNVVFDYNGLECNIKIRSSEVNIEQFHIEEDVTNKVIEEWESESLWLFQLNKRNAKGVETSIYYFADQDMLTPWFQKLRSSLNSNKEKRRELWERTSLLLDNKFSTEEREEIESIFLGKGEDEKIITDASITKRFIDKHCIRIAGQDVSSEICNILEMIPKVRQKTCPACNVSYPLVYFSKDRRRGFGWRENNCRSCRGERAKSLIADQREKVNELQRKRWDAMTRGVYCIKNTRDGRCYVGQSSRIERRIAEHKRDLRKGCHVNPRLQEAWIEFGEKAFEFSILEKLPKDATKKLLLEREKTHINNFYKKDVTMYNALQ